MNPTKITAHQIVDILRSQHTKDVFVDECKNGPSMGTTHARMDAWVMTRSWSHLRFTGYEIKISRSDFLGDNKWPAYLPLCNQLYFVSPKGLIDKSEVPAGIGLKYAISSRCLTILKAEYRECKPPMELFCYLLMARTRIVDTTYYQPETPESKLDKYRKWMAEKQESRKLGEVMKHEIARKMERIQAENTALKKRLDYITTAERILGEMGIRHNWYNDDEQSIRQGAKKFLEQIPEDFISDLRQIQRTCNSLQMTIEEKRKELAGK